MAYSSSPEQFSEQSGYEIDGKWYPRVTKILEIKSKPALYRFYASMPSFEHGEDMKQKSADEGTLVHETVQALAVGKQVDIDPSIKPAVDAFLEFTEKKRIKFVPEFIEKRLVNNRDRYAGTIDAVAHLDGRIGVLDIKTSQSIYRDYNLQTAAYMGVLTDESFNLSAGGPIDTRWILRIDQMKKCNRCGSTLRPKGGREKIKRPFPSYGFISCPEDAHEWSELKGIIELKEFPGWQTDFEAFLAAKKLWEWENEYLLKKIGYLRDGF